MTFWMEPVQPQSTKPNGTSSRRPSCTKITFKRRHPFPGIAGHHLQKGWLCASFSRTCGSALQAEFQNSDLSVKVDPQTGAITFDAGIFFSVGSAGISEEGDTFLKEFVPQYLSVLLGDDFRDNISEIIIEGHTDTNGTYMYNLDLSQTRAYYVAEFCLNERNGVLTADQIVYLRNILTANGRSYSDPIYDAYGRIDPEASRRVVFKFRLIDDEMIEAIQEVLGERND